MDSGKALIVDLGDCDDETKRLFGTMIVTGFEQAALSRARVPMQARNPYYLYIDEFQDFACPPKGGSHNQLTLVPIRGFEVSM